MEKQFRAWDDKNKKFAFTDFHIIGEVMLFDLIRQYNLEHQLDLKITQWTGLFDADGVKIYEGDIVTLFTSLPREILFKEGGFGYESKLSGDDFIHMGSNHNFKWNKNKSDSVKVIGNIYMNSNLLTGV